MNRKGRIIWGATLCFFVSGCAVAYQPAALPGEMRQDSEGAQLNTVQSGEAVRITMLSGKKVAGEFVEVNDDMLTLKYKSGGRYWNREIELSEIEKIEIEETTGKLSTAGAVIIGVIVVGVVVGGIVLASVDTSWGNSSP